MKPKNPNEGERSQLQLFQARLDSQLNPDHPLVVLAGLIDWEHFDQAYASLFCPDNGAPALPTRLMVGLEYLKYTDDLSDEELVARWLENPYWQYFCGEDYFRNDLPLHYTSLGKWRLRIRYEFGNKAAVTTNNRNWIVEDLADNPYDGHTLNVSLVGTERLTKVTVVEANVDKGYRGHDYKGAATIRLAGSSNRGLSYSERKRKKRRSAIEPVIGHLKSDHRLDRCFLKGQVGDALNLIGSAAGFNVRKLLRLLGRGIFSPAPIWTATIHVIWRKMGDFFHRAFTARDGIPATVNARRRFF